MQLNNKHSREWGPYRAEWQNLTKQEWAEGRRKYNEACDRDNPEATDEELEMLEPKVRVQFYKNGVPTYVLAKNNYRTENDDDLMLLEWFAMPNDQSKTVHIFNLSHSEIAVIDADTGKTLFRSYAFDMFITNYQLLDNREYLYLCGWVWSPFPSREIFHIPTLLTRDKVEGISVPYDGPDRNLNPPVDIYGFATCEEFLANKDRYFNEKRAIEAARAFNENGKKCFLGAVLNPQPDEIARIEIADSLRTELNGLFSNRLKMLFVDSIGNISGYNLHNDWCFYTNEFAYRKLGDWIKKDQLTYYVMQIIGCPGFVNMSIQIVDFRFEVEAIYEDITKPRLKFVINIQQKYKPSDKRNTCNEPIFEPDPDNPLKITISKL